MLVHFVLHNNLFCLQIFKFIIFVCRLQHLMLDNSLHIIFWFTSHALCSNRKLFKVDSICDPSKLSYVVKQQFVWVKTGYIYRHTKSNQVDMKMSPDFLGALYLEV
jgi:hypothetical protein